VGTRRAFTAGVTANPDSAWVTQQARNASIQMAEWGLPARFLLLDHDAKFTGAFDSVFEADGTEVKRVGPVAPNLNAYAERYAQTLRKECLDHFLVLGENHLRHLLREWGAPSLDERPPQAKGTAPLSVADAGEPVTLPFPSGEIVCRARLGGLLRHYHRQAA